MQIVPKGEKAFQIINAKGHSPIVLVCEHASNHIPASLKRLGLKPEDLERHIAYDIGAFGVARGLSKLLDAPLIAQRYSRLIYDCNRSPEQPGAMPEKSEIFAIPGNRKLSPKARMDRISQISRPFHRAIEDFLDARAAALRPTALVSIHSFTRIYHGKSRTVDLGLLCDWDTRLARGANWNFPGFSTQENQPYGPADGVMHLMNLHGATRGLHHLMIEIGNDLIENQSQQQQWAKRLAKPLKAATKALGG
jgi:predicted N-formylglutamate amidohydrolase